MTTNEALKSIQRHRRERRSIPPFGSGAAPNTISNILDRVLARCRCDPFTDMSFSKEDIFFLSPDDIDRSIQPQFKIVVDFTNDITNRLSIHRDDLELGLSVRSSYLRRYAVLGRWSIHSIPSDPWSPDPAKLKGLQSGRGMDFVLALRVATTRKELVRQGLEPGKVLTRKVFSVKETADTFTFPFQWVRFGGDTGYPDQALWVIQWTDGEDDAHFERPVDQVLTVMVNEKAEGPLSAMDEVHGANDLAWRMLAADITTQIWTDVLSKTDYEPDPADTDTLVGQVFARLSRAGNMPYSEINALVERDDSLTELRSLVSQILKLVA